MIAPQPTQNASEGHPRLPDPDGLAASAAVVVSASAVSAIAKVFIVLVLHC